MIKPDVALSAHTQLTRPAVLRVDRSKRKDLSLFPGKVDHREEDAWEQSRLLFVAFGILFTSFCVTFL